MPSINVDLSFFSHRKTIRLSAQLGDQAIACLLRLWCYAGQHDPEYGSLGDMLDYEIEHIANWRGERGCFVRSLISIGFLDMVDGKARIHDWHDHARHLIIYRERAKKGASAKWNARLSRDASSMLEADSPIVKSIGYASSIPSSNAKDTLSIVPIQYNTIQDNTKKKSSALQVRKPSAPTAIDEDWLNTVRGTYSWIDVQREFVKCQTWCEVNRKSFSRRRLINWLNRIEKPLTPIAQKKYEGSYHKKVVL